MHSLTSIERGLLALGIARDLRVGVHLRDDALPTAQLRLPVRQLCVVRAAGCDRLLHSHRCCQRQGMRLFFVCIYDASYYLFVVNALRR